MKDSFPKFNEPLNFLISGAQCTIIKQRCCQRPARITKSIPRNSEEAEASKNEEAPVSIESKHKKSTYVKC